MSGWGNSGKTGMEPAYVNTGAIKITLHNPSLEPSEPDREPERMRSPS